MTIGETVLVQVYATVLVGILIFMTVQRLFEWRERFEEKSSRLIQLRENAIKDKEALQDELDRHEKSWKGTIELSPSFSTNPDYTKPYEDEMKRLQGLIRMKDDEINRRIDDLYSLTGKYRENRDLYKSLRTRERNLNTVMIILLVASIIIILVGSVIDIQPLTSVISIISVIIFSVGIILLIFRVYLHGQEIEEEEHQVKEGEVERGEGDNNNTTNARTSTKV